MTTIVVIGNGLFGSAASRHLAERGAEVIAIGADPVGADVRTSPEETWPSHRVYSSHNDAARLTRLQDRDPAWAAVTQRAVAEYRTIERASGISFYADVGCLIASRPGGDGTNPDPRAQMDDVPHVFYAPGDDAWRPRWPQLDFPSTHYVAFEGPPAGYLRPKSLIQAQNLLADRAGAERLSDTVTAVAQVGAGFEVETASGRTIAADKVLIAAGAFTNFNGLLPDPVDLTLKSEVIALAEVSEEDAAALARYPTVKYLNDGDDLDAIYMTPPVRYEDGRSYIKIGANTRLDVELDDLGAVQEWFNTDTDGDYLPLYEPALRAMWPTTNFRTIRTQPCIITYTPNRTPLIDKVESGLYVATAGNGGGAKGSDAWGAMAADMVLA